MRVLIAYDGSESANKGIEDLIRAGLPSEADALVVTVAEVWLPPPPDVVTVDTLPHQISEALKRAQARAAQIVRLPGKMMLRVLTRHSYRGFA